MSTYVRTTRVVRNAKKLYHFQPMSFFPKPAREELPIGSALPGFIPLKGDLDYSQWFDQTIPLSCGDLKLNNVDHTLGTIVWWFRDSGVRVLTDMDGKVTEIKE